MMDSTKKPSRTKRRIHKAFVELLEEKGFYAIRVKEIIDRADISRATFYSHYEDKYQLIAELRDTLFEGLIDSMKQVRQQGIGTILNYDYNSAPLQTEYFLVVQQNARLWHIFFSGKGEIDFSQRFTAVIADFLYATSNIWGNEDPHMPAPLSVNIGAWTTTGMISYWILNGMKETPQEMGEWLAVFWKRFLTC